MVRVNGYNVVYSDIEDCGRLDRDKNEIIIDNKLPIGQQELAILHEILHAINGEISEELIDSLAVSIHQVLRDNY